MCLSSHCKKLLWGLLLWPQVEEARKPSEMHFARIFWGICCHQVPDVMLSVGLGPVGLSEGCSGCAGLRGMAVSLSTAHLGNQQLQEESG